MPSQALPAPFAAVLARYWKPIAGLGVLCGALGAVVFYGIQRPRYGATALLFIASDRLELAFDPKMRNLPEERLDVTTRRRTMEVLATSTAVVSRTFDQIRTKLLPAEQDLFHFRNWLDASTVGEVLRLHVLSREPVLSAEVANTWSDALREVAHTTLGGREPGSGITDEQSRQALQTYNDAQTAVVGFSVKEDRVAALESRLRNLRAQMDERYQYVSRVQKCLRDVDHLITEMKGEKEAVVSFQLASDLAVLGIRMNSLESPSAPVSLQFQLSGLRTAGAAAPVLLVELERVSAALRARLGELERQLEDVKPHQAILEIQGEIEQLTGKRRELVGARDVAWETFLTISRKVAESRLASEMSGGVVRLASRAKPEPLPENSGKLFNTLLAMFAGLVAGFIGVCLGPARALVFGEEFGASPPTTTGA